MSIIQKKLDSWIETGVLRYVPKSVKPNHFTILRIILVPVVLYLIMSEQFGWALVAFVLAAVLDLLDGALARKRNLITSMGQFLDPLADKALIFFTSLFLAYFYIFPVLVILSASLELAAVTLSALIFMVIRKKHMVPANWFGKMKMLCQVVSTLLILLSLTFGWLWLSLIAVIVLLLAIILEILSFISYETEIISHS